MNRADQIEAVATVLFQRDWPGHALPDGIAAEPWLGDATAVVDAVLPQITTAEQLEALPLKAKVLDAQGDMWEKYHSRLAGWGDSWRTVGNGTPYRSQTLTQRGPLTAVWQPQPAGTQLRVTDAGVCT